MGHAIYAGNIYISYVCVYYIYLGIYSQRALLPMWATLRFIVCVCVEGGEEGGLRGNQHTQQGTMPQMQLGMS